MKHKKIVITGGTGYLAQMLARKWGKENSVFLLTSTLRTVNNNFNKKLVSKDDGLNVTYRCWMGNTDDTEWQQDIEGADLVVNLAGKTVNCRYNESNKNTVLSSRIETTNRIGHVVAHSIHPPKLWINMSSATIYAHSMDHPQNEISGRISPLKKDNMPFSFLDQMRFGWKRLKRQLIYGADHAKVRSLNEDFSVAVCRQWESAFFAHRTPFTRKIAARTAIVIGAGGVFTACCALAKAGWGGKQGSGKQKFSWIHEEDFARALEFCVAESDVEGAINFSAPKVSTNEEWMQLIRKSCNINWGLSLPEWILEVGAKLKGTETELLLKSRWVEPALLLKNGFQFRYPEISMAIAAITSEN